MSDANGPVVIRRPTTYFAKPGIHSHNITRRIDHGKAKRAILSRLRAVLLLIGLCGLGYYAYTLADQYVYQAYQNWAFDQQISGNHAVTFADYVRERTPFSFLVGVKPAEAPKAAVAVAPNAPPEEIPRPVDGSVLGRVEIPRLNLSAIVREGVEAETLKVAVGHVPSTALPGQAGNFAIAAHRDTLFRALKDIKKDDLITFQSPSGNFRYQVLATKIVKPSDVSVLRSDGGGLIARNLNPGSNTSDPQKILTMITCYPFYYVGSAPKRFIVEAELVPPKNAQNVGPPASVNNSVSAPAPTTKVTKQANVSGLRHNRSPSHSLRSHSAQEKEAQPMRSKPARKRGFWHKVFHVS